MERARRQSAQISRWLRLHYVSGLSAVLGGGAVALTFASLRWRYDFDTPLLLYVAHLLDLGYTPYRDVFDVNLPATYLVNLFSLKVFGHSDLAVRLGDLSLLSVLGLTTWSWLRRLGNRLAFCGVALFVLMYLGHGPLFTLQRDYLLLVPVSAALWVAIQWPHKKWLRSFGIGLLFGVAVQVKPHALVGLPVLLALTEVTPGEAGPLDVRRAKDLAAGIVVAAAGFAIPVLLAVLYLAHEGAWASFVDIARNYWPLFSELSGEQQMLPDLKTKLEYRSLKLAESLGQLPLLVPACWGLFVGLRRSQLDAERQRIVLILGGMALAFALYAVLAGRFWAYHWIPFLYFLTLLVACCLVPQRDQRPSLLVLTVATLQLGALAVPQLYFSGLHALPNNPKNGLVDELTSYLEENLRPGDKVQPLDWTEGSLNAMLRVGAEPGTRFIYTYMFHHHVSHPYTQDLRREFIQALRTGKPRFVIEIHQIWYWVTGEDTSPSFPELRNLLKSDYLSARETSRYTIHEIRLTAPQEQPRP